MWVYIFTRNKYYGIRGSETTIVTLKQNCHLTFTHPATDCDTRDKDCNNLTKSDYAVLNVINFN